MSTGKANTKVSTIGSRTNSFISLTASRSSGTHHDTPSSGADVGGRMERPSAVAVSLIRAISASSRSGWWTRRSGGPRWSSPSTAAHTGAISWFVPTTRIRSPSRSHRVDTGQRGQGGRVERHRRRERDGGGAGVAGDQLGRGAGVDDAAAAHHRHPVAQRLGLVHEMGDQHDRACPGRGRRGWRPTRRCGRAGRGPG